LYNVRLTAQFLGFSARDRTIWVDHRPTFIKEQHWGISEMSGCEKNKRAHAKENSIKVLNMETDYIYLHENSNERFWNIFKILCVESGPDCQRLLILLNNS
jgi:hypothetical protein